MSDELFVIDDEMDELAFFKLGWHRSLYASGMVRHTVLPNLSCNLDCPYCFESKNGKFIDKETEKNYLSWLEPQLANANSFYLTWFGGEPLLSKPTIERITKEILRMQKDYNFEFVASLVTNGVLLDDDFISKASALGIKTVQVTIDGDKPIHDKYRFFKNSDRGTFDVIMQNMSKFCEMNESDIASIVRINVTDESYNSVPDLLDRIPEAVKKKCFIFFRWVYPHKNGRSPGREFSEKMKGESPFTNLALLYELAESKGFTTNSFDEGLAYNFCECDFDGAYLIDQDGDLFMCSHSMDKEEAVGNVKDGFGSQKNLSRYANFIGANPFEDAECLSCKILPLCKGGCRKARYLGMKTCSDVKYDVENYVLQKYHKAVSDIEKYAVSI